MSMSTSSIEDEVKKESLRDKFRGEKEGGSYYEPSNKKMKRDWPGKSYTMMTSYVPPNKNDTSKTDIGSTTSSNNDASISSLKSYQPLSYNNWLDDLTDLKRKSSESELKSMYENYKRSVLLEACEDFFKQHKNEPWFRSRYYPGEKEARDAERRECIMERKKAFMTLVDKIEDLSLEVGRSKEIVRFLDSVVILLEGGSIEDLKMLDKEESSDSMRNSVSSMPAKFTEPLRLDATGQADYVKREDEVSESGSISDSDEETSKTSGPKTASGPDATTTNEESKEADAPNEMMDAEVKEVDEVLSEEGKEVKENDDVVEGEKDKIKEEEKDGGDSSVDPSASDAKVNGEEEKDTNTEGKDDDKDKENDAESNEPVNTTTHNTPPVCKKERLLHKTVSLFVREIPVSATKQQLQEVFASVPGFLRLALQDPRPDTQFKTRSGWATFENWVNVKDLCWNMRDIRLHEKLLNVTVNSELKQRLRGVTGITSHKPVAKNDVKTIVKIIQYLDTLYSVWEDRDVDKETLGFVSSNPLLKNITEHLVEEGSYEEEALLYKAGAYWDEYEEDKKKPAHAEIFLEQDVALLKALDRLILYLRVVHSFDYYVSSDYSAEVSMPHLCGIMHVREACPQHKVTQAHLDEWQNAFEAKVSIYAEGRLWKSDFEMQKWMKNEENEAEKFIKENTQELSSDKWLCPLSGKKFKGADFVRKHILTKHHERLQEVKFESHYFNNFVRDNRRPQFTPPAPQPLPSANLTASQQAPLPTNHQKSKYPGGSMMNPMHHQAPHHRFNPYPMPRFPSFSSSVRKPGVPMRSFNHTYRPPMNGPEMHHGMSHMRPMYRIPGDTYRPRDKFVPRRGR